MWRVLYENRACKRSYRPQRLSYPTGAISSTRRAVYTHALIVLQQFASQIVLDQEREDSLSLNLTICWVSYFRFQSTKRCNREQLLNEDKRGLCVCSSLAPTSINLAGRPTKHRWRLVYVAGTVRDSWGLRTLGRW